jgi:hypothetical protein
VRRKLIKTQKKVVIFCAKITKPLLLEIDSAHKSHDAAFYAILYAHLSSAELFLGTTTVTRELKKY